MSASEKHKRDYGEKNQGQNLLSAKKQNQENQRNTPVHSPIRLDTKFSTPQKKEEYRTLYHSRGMGIGSGYDY